jgi:hypothetical protein
MPGGVVWIMPKKRVSKDGSWPNPIWSLALPSSADFRANLPTAATRGTGTRGTSKAFRSLMARKLRKSGALARGLYFVITR